MKSFNLFLTVFICTLVFYVFNTQEKADYEGFIKMDEMNESPSRISLSVIPYSCSDE